MHPLLKRTQYAFIGFTLVQIAVFLFTAIYAGLEEGMDLLPHTPISKYLGIAELGLMSMYLAATYHSYLNFTLFTIVLRATTLPFILFQILVLGLEWYALAGITQDLLFGGIALYYAREAGHGFVRYRFESIGRDNFYHALCRLVVIPMGTFDVVWGVETFLNPHASTVLDAPFKGKEWVGIRVIGYVTILIGMYQIFSGVMGGAPSQFFLSVGLHHLLLYLMGNYVYGHLFNIPAAHLAFGLIISFLALWAIEEERADVLKNARLVTYRIDPDADDADAVFYMSEEEDE